MLDVPRLTAPPRHAPSRSGPARPGPSRPGPTVPAAGGPGVKRHGFAEIAAGAVVLLAAVLFLAYAVTNSGRSAAGGGLVLTARFDRIDGLAAGADVRIAGVKVGSVTGQRIDPATFLAVLTLNVDQGLHLPEDSSAEITSEGLLGGKYVALVPGGSDRNLASGGEVKITQSAVSLESLLGRFIFSVTELAGNQAQRAGSGSPAPAPAAAPPAAGAAPAARPPAAGRPR
ncbi:outer membrane lipid asymmetry maintenance protein MlaD [Roseomonas nepalensis]|uniref:Outer membrane lipid asymmetry maintenance protein MlaD n=1 Tax=Muricoccus nepalensis TaxID=1854500 RepID=A0A502GCA2_9PROT|nr:outer membrane lipid asymmetry maintenance protein MlaD [Roseomonas nepalensis]